MLTNKQVCLLLSTIFLFTMFATSCCEKCKDCTTTGEIIHYKTLGDKYVKSFVYTDHKNKNKDGVGILRVINTNSDHREFLPAMLYDNNNQSSSVDLDSVVYSKVKIIEGIPYAYDIQTTKPSANLIFDFSKTTPTRSLQKEWKFDMHNTVGHEYHNPRSIHRRGHVWKVTNDVENTNFSILYINYHANNSRSNPIIKRDTLFVSQLKYENIDFGLDSLLYISKFDDTVKVGMHKYRLLKEATILHTHPEHHNEKHR